MENSEREHLDEILKDSTLNNPDLTFCEKTTYLDFLLSNAQTKEEEEKIKDIIDNFLQIYDEDEDKKSNIDI